MWVKIGSADGSSNIVDLLIACHQRIRFFVDLARRLAEAEVLPIDEVRDTAMRIVRYFSESLPLHIADEEESIIPRLSGHAPELDATLQAMQREHREHESQLQTLLKTCRILQTSPERLDQLRNTLRTAASALERGFVAHLREEERVVMPAIRSLLSN